MSTIAALHRVQVPPALRNFSANAGSLCRNIREIPVPGYKRVAAIDDPRSGLKAVIALHSPVLGPGLGGLRVLPYKDFQSAVMDVTRLARGMSHKSALAGTGLGGGKSVIISEPEKVTDEMLKTYAVFLNSFKGAYITAEDVGSTVEMMDFIGRYSPYVTGLSHAKSGGNPSPITAQGVLRGIQAICQILDGSDSVKGKTVAIQGLGSVGTSLAELLFWHGAKLIVADVNPRKVDDAVKRFGASSCLPAEIHKQECDILAPCALGGTLNNRTIPELRCRAVVGCANNQLLTDADADSLQRRKILYGPDFAVNAGGIISVGSELGVNGHQPCEVRDAVDRIYDTVKDVVADAIQANITTHKAAVSLAESRIQKGLGARTIPPCFHHWPEGKKPLEVIEPMQFVSTEPRRDLRFEWLP